MKKLLEMCKAVSISYWITPKGNWCFKAKDNNISTNDLSDIQQHATTLGLAVKLFASTAKFDESTGQKVTTDAQFVVMPPKATSDDEMLNSFNN